jgi:peptide/nickel transport system permease protein
VARYVVGRLIGVVGVLIAVSLITFVMMHLVPGGPFDVSDKLQISLPAHIRQVQMEKYGLDKPIYMQYLVYMSNAVRGEFGMSIRYGESVAGFIKRAWPVTAKLGLIAAVLAIVIGLAMGILAALKPNSWLDYLTSVTVVTWIVTPTFVVAILMIYLFAVKLGWFPTGGWGEPRQVVMPVIAYMLGPAASIARYTRSSMLETLNQDYIRTARAKGLREGRVVLRHAFKNALIPILTVLGPMIASMITGSFFIETMFRIPGIGNQLTFAIFNRDYPIIMALTLLWSALIAIAYLFTDLLYAWADPRVQVGGAK